MDGKKCINLIESMGLAVREKNPVNVWCQYCGEKEVYLWRHITGYYIGIECLACGTVGLIIESDRQKAINLFLDVKSHRVVK